MAKVPVISVSTTVRPYDDPDKVAKALTTLFPDWDTTKLADSESFPVTREPYEIGCEGCSPDTMVEALAQQRILDTALDAMSMNIEKNTTWFLISRQAAIASKVAFILEGENPVGGIIHVEMESEDLASWIEEITWHPGRQDIPREIGDEYRMSDDGEVTEWFDKKGQPTMNIEE
ncbi:MAG: hypothetical protein VX320_02625 [Candidatus Thermoplasmatota archaeon]|nr:hypothetical protein [Candidatus Thermoplasmatota archaeon]MEE3082970.1 hypothetical protein [Candidatus Thermoplasmatota archaeon]